MPGASAWFRGGVVCYANDLKSALADVPQELIRTHGAVSEAVARALASGARRACGADLGLAITGVAGPSGGTSEKPVGTVHVALDDGIQGRERKMDSPGPRAHPQTLGRGGARPVAPPHRAMRAFLAIVPEELRRAAAEAGRALALPDDWRLSEDALHVTVRFLGECDPPTGSARRGLGRGDVRVEPCGCASKAWLFPGTRRPRVIWLGGKIGTALGLAARVEQAARALGFPRRGRCLPT
jgi:hypothetical protein